MQINNHLSPFVLHLSSCRRRKRMPGRLHYMQKWKGIILIIVMLQHLNTNEVGIMRQFIERINSFKRFPLNSELLYAISSIVILTSFHIQCVFILFTLATSMSCLFTYKTCREWQVHFCIVYPSSFARGLPFFGRQLSTIFERIFIRAALVTAISSDTFGISANRFSLWAISYSMTFTTAVEAYGVCIIFLPVAFSRRSLACWA